uniref:Uncharacterized protein n=1 Tax=Anser cygnoides TaxID=8845 RepID=A0A8B9EKU4_ANSCY
YKGATTLLALAALALLAAAHQAHGEGNAVKLCGRDFVRAIVFTCGGSRWKRDLADYQYLFESMLKEKKTPLLNSARYLLQLYNLPVAVPGCTVVFKMHMNYKHGLSGNIQELCVSDVLTQ